MSVLKNLEVPLPPVDVQQQVVEIFSIRQQEKKTARELEAKRDEYIRELLIQRVSGA
jgi:restriction endonuclease S subunit